MANKRGQPPIYAILFVSYDVAMLINGRLSPFVFLVRFLGSVAWLQPIYFLWRPYLPDPSDDMILELALAAGCRYIVTHNVRHFAASEKLGIKPVTPGELIGLLTKDAKP